MLTLADANTRLPCPRYLSRDRERRALREGPAGSTGPDGGRVWTHREHTRRLSGARALGGETERREQVLGAEKGAGDGSRPQSRGSGMQGQDREGPRPAPSPGTEGTLCAASAPGPRLPRAARTAQYLRMVCVMDIWRCSAGRRGSWWGEGTRAGSAGMLTLRRNAWRLKGWATGSW